jgi:hypothetical protein
LTADGEAVVGLDAVAPFTSVPWLREQQNGAAFHHESRVPADGVVGAGASSTRRAALGIGAAPMRSFFP